MRELAMSEPAMSAPVLAIRDLCKSYGALRVTDHVSLDVHEGEIHAIIGPNGAGKTTLIAQIAGALHPDAGTIALSGKDISRLHTATRAQLGLARVFQISNIIAPFTALENVALAAQAKFGSSWSFWRPAAADRGLIDRAEAALATVGLQARALTKAANLSHGEARSLEIAMCLVQQPKLLLLDEPMAGAGPEETRELTRVLLGLKGKVAMLLIEHDMATVFALADRLSLLVGGAVAASGTPAMMRNDAAVRKAYLGDEAS